MNRMADLFHKDVPFEFIKSVFATMNIASQHTFQVLTKRPDRMLEFVEWYQHNFFIDDTSFEEAFPNVWLGTSIENQTAADERVPLLLQVPAAVRFLSCEPLLGPVDLDRWITTDEMGVPVGMEIDWVIAGGESGPNARPMHPDWAMELRDQCQAAGVAFFFKQFGEWAPVHDLRCNEPGIKGKRWHTFDPDTSVCRIGKDRAGRLLDGREWNEFPGAI